MVTTPRPAPPTAAEADGRGRLRLPPDWILTDARMAELGALNPGLRFERSAEGAVELMIWPTPRSARASVHIFVQLHRWAETAGGEAAHADCGYSLPDGSARIPDASWIDAEQLAAHGAADRMYQFAPRLVVEVRSQGQSVASQQRKLQTAWIANGVRLGWLVDPYSGRVWIYRADGSVEELDRPSRLSGEDVCEGLSVDLSALWVDQSEPSAH